MNAPTVFHDECGTKGYRSAVATIIGDIEIACKVSLLDIAEAVDASRDTISDAKRGHTTLNPVHLARLGRRYGASFLNPYLALFGAQAAPLMPTATRDILPLASRVVHKVACARDPDGPGGVAEVPQERAEYLPDLKRLHHEVGCLIPQIEVALA